MKLRKWIAYNLLGVEKAQQPKNEIALLYEDQIKALKMTIQSQREQIELMRKGGLEKAIITKTATREGNKILNTLKQRQDQTLTAKEIQEELGISKTKTWEEIRKLEKENHIEVLGTTKKKYITLKTG